MNFSHSRLVWAFVIAASVVLASCGGSGGTALGIDGTGSPPVPTVAYGRLSGFGSIEVNGVHYDTTGATFLIDGVTGGPADLKLGNIVLLVGQMQPGATRGVAQQVISDHVLLGRVDSVSSDGLSLVALGQTVRVDNQTLFSADLAAGLSALSVGDAVSVSGFRNAAGDIVATRVERQNAGAVAFKTTGAVTVFDPTNKRLEINGLVVDYSGAQVLPADAASTIARGVFVEVKAGVVTALQQIAATSVEIKRQRVPGSPGAGATVEGYVTALDQSDAGRFHIDGLPVLTTAATVGVGAIAIGPRINVNGTLSPVGEVVAGTISACPGCPFPVPPATQPVEGRVFDAISGPVAAADVDMFIGLGGSGYSLRFSRGGSPLQSDADGHFKVFTPVGALVEPIYATKAGFVQPCAVFGYAKDGVFFEVELVAESTLDASNPPPPQSAMGATTTTGTVYEVVAGNRQPIAGARLWFGGIDLTYATTVTDRDGRYLACNLPNGTPGGMELDVRKPGFKNTSVYPIDTSRSTVVDIELERQ